MLETGMAGLPSGMRMSGWVEACCCTQSAALLAPWLPPWFSCRTPPTLPPPCPTPPPACRYDKYCPFYKSCDMLRNMITFYEAANEAVERTASAGGDAAGGPKLTYNVIKARLGMCCTS